MPARPVLFVFTPLAKGQPG